jgi:alkylation response protein AidB-like acyl-CoA dehydrogenase
VICDLRSAGVDIRPIRTIDGSRHFAEVAAMRALTYAGVSRNMRRAEPGPEGSMIKLFYAELAQRVYRLAMDMLGVDALRRGSVNQNHDWHHGYLMSYAESIAGGTSEVNRNIVAERLLGLPR